ncbi:MAG: hypothetical protein ACM3H8_04695 [Sphingobacteriales bacterium]
MKNYLIRILLFSLIASFAISCQKEASNEILGAPNQQNNALIGTWKFSFLNAKTKVEEQATDGTDVEKAITTSDYTSFNNKGTYVFNTTDAIGTGIAYDIDVVAKTEYYINNVLEDTFSFPFAFSLPPVNASSKYKLVGADSVYFSGGFLSAGIDSLQAKPIGYKFSIAGNRLTLRTNYFNTYAEDDNGVTINVKQNADITVVLEK